MGIRLSAVEVRMVRGLEPTVHFTIMPTGGLLMSGMATVPQHLLDNLKSAAHNIALAIGEGQNGTNAD